MHMISPTTNVSISGVQRTKHSICFYDYELLLFHYGYRSFLFYIAAMVYAWNCNDHHSLFIWWLVAFLGYLGPLFSIIPFNLHGWLNSCAHHLSLLGPLSSHACIVSVFGRREQWLGEQW